MDGQQRCVQTPDAVALVLALTLERLPDVQLTPALLYGAHVSQEALRPGLDCAASLRLQPDRRHPAPVLGQLLHRRGQADARLRGGP
eukprot:9628632-Alexandrium_andersonii.AAC.1